MPAAAEGPESELSELPDLQGLDSSLELLAPDDELLAPDDELPEPREFDPTARPASARCRRRR